MDTLAEGVVGTFLLLVAWLFGAAAGKNDYVMGWLALIIILGAFVIASILFVGAAFGIVEPLV